MWPTGWNETSGGGGPAFGSMLNGSMSGILSELASTGNNQNSAYGTVSV